MAARKEGELLRLRPSSDRANHLWHGLKVPNALVDAFAMQSNDRRDHGIRSPVAEPQHRRLASVGSAQRVPGRTLDLFRH